MVHKLRLKPHCVLPDIYGRLTDDLLASAGDWVFVDEATQTITIMTDEQVRELFDVDGGDGSNTPPTTPASTDPSPSSASTPPTDPSDSDEEGLEAKGKPWNGNGGEAADTRRPFLRGGAILPRRKGIIPFASVPIGGGGGGTCSISAAAVLVLSCLSELNCWASAQEISHLCPDPAGRASAHLALLLRGGLVARKSRERDMKRYLLSCTPAGHALARDRGQAALDWLSRQPLG